MTRLVFLLLVAMSLGAWERLATANVDVDGGEGEHHRTAQVSTAHREASERAGLWQRWERAFTAEAEADGQHIELLVELTAPSGREQTVRGFWDGGDTWRVRFMPGEVGTWTYLTTSEPAVSGLHGVSGSFECEPNPGGTPFLEHGPVRVAAAGTYLEHADGTPFFWLVDTAWNGALHSRPDDWDRFLQDRLDKRFTGVKFVMTQWRAAETNAEGLLAYTGFDEIEIHPAFFERMDERIDAVTERGLLAVPVLLWTLGDPEQNPGQLPESEAIRLARYMVARYQANHAMYFLPGDGNYSGENAERWKRIGEAVFDLPGHAPAMLHPGGMQWPYAEWRDVDWVAVEAYQSGHGDDHPNFRWIHSGPPATYWSEEPIRPVINVEPPYEDHVAYQSRERHTAYSVRRATYWSLLNAPTAGVSYGAHGIWSWQEEPAEPLNHSGTGVAKVWHEAMHLPGSTHLKHMAELFGSMEWWKLRPDQGMAEQTLQPGAVRTASTHVVYARDPDGHAALYVDGELQGGAQIDGDVSNWIVEHRLALGDEIVGGRPWLGEYRRVAVYDRAFGEEEVRRLFAAGPAGTPPPALVLYSFGEGEGRVVRDVSGVGDALDLHIENPGAVEWLPGGGLRLRAPARVVSEIPARKIVDAVRETGAVAVEAWIVPENATQAGPARIVTLSQDHGSRNFTLGQEFESYEMRLRTTETSSNGLPGVRTADESDRFIAASRTEAGDAAVAYLPLGGRVTLRLDRLAPGVAAHWFDPRTGDLQPARPAEDGTFVAPDDEQDWVLRFQ